MIGSLTDLSRRSGMPSEVTLRRLIALHPDFPIVKRGTHGKRYQINLEEAEQFVRSLSQARQVSHAERLECLQSLGLSLTMRTSNDG
jgi:hypothetical protein